MNGQSENKAAFPAKKMNEPQNGVKEDSPGKGSPERGNASLGEKNLAGIAENKASQPAQETSFESAFARLETILERMNSGTISLDESLKLYEEADALISTCNKRLNDAERKIEILIKNRGGDLALSSDQKPMTQDFPFSPPTGNPTKD